MFVGCTEQQKNTNSKRMESKRIKQVKEQLEEKVTGGFASQDKIKKEQARISKSDRKAESKDD